MKSKIAEGGKKERTVAGSDCVHSYMPVSYTHLDVYKRQSINSVTRGQPTTTSKGK